MIELKNITKAFNAGTVREVVALHNINLYIAEREFVVLLGSNGSGKTSLLNLIAGTEKPSSGKIFLGRENVTSLDEYKRSKWIARIFQNPFEGTASDLTLEENFRLACLRTQLKKLKTGINKNFRNEVKEKISLLSLGLENKLQQKMGALSGGQRQALTLIMAVMADSKILLMDEPAAALDPRTSELLMLKAEELINKLKLTAVFITHNLKDALRFGSRIVLLDRGSISKDIMRSEKEKLTLTELREWF